MRSSKTLSKLGIATTLIVLAVAFTAATPTDRGVKRGRDIFRFDTFGSDQLWTDVLQMHDVIQSAVDPATALAVGLKVDVDALPQEVRAALAAGQVDLHDPAVTVELLRLNAVVGVIGRVRGGNLTQVGITCALCHSTVDDSFAPGIGHRLDGWANRDLDPGKILSLSPALGDTVKAELVEWGPGRFDPRHHVFDGNAIEILHDDSLPVLIPPIYGLDGVSWETYTADGPISYWNRYVGVSQMGGKGDFTDERIDIAIDQEPDLVSPKLPALLRYQLSLAAPVPASDSFDAAAARRGRRVFRVACASCHVPPTYTDVADNGDPGEPVVHAPDEVGQDKGYADRTATGAYRTTPLRALWAHPPYFHDGSAQTLDAVVDHYDDHLELDLSEGEKDDLVEFLKSL